MSTAQATMSRCNVVLVKRPISCELHLRIGQAAHPGRAQFGANLVQQVLDEQVSPTQSCLQFNQSIQVAQANPLRYALGALQRYAGKKL